MNAEMAYRITLGITGLGMDPEDGDQVIDLLDVLREFLPSSGPVVTTNRLVDRIELTLAIDAADAVSAMDVAVGTRRRALQVVGLPPGRIIALRAEEIAAEDEVEPAPAEPAVA